MPPCVPAILLAAGMSRRMGCLKQLLPLGDLPVISHCLTSMMSAGIDDIVVVLGGDHESVAAEIIEYPVRIVWNRDSESDMAGSVRAGMRAIPPSASGVLIALTDHPLVTPATYRSLLDNHQNDPQKIILPVHSGKGGHPTLFPANVLRELDTLPTLRDLLRFAPDRLLYVESGDIGVTLDMDTPADYETVVKLYRRRGDQG